MTEDRKRVIAGVKALEKKWPHLPMFARITKLPYTNGNTTTGERHKLLEDGMRVIDYVNKMEQTGNIWGLKKLEEMHPEIEGCGGGSSRASAGSRASRSNFVVSQNKVCKLCHRPFIPNSNRQMTCDRCRTDNWP